MTDKRELLLTLVFLKFIGYRFNLVYLSVIHSEIKAVKYDVKDVLWSVNDITKPDGLKEDMMRGIDPLNPEPTRIQDVIDKIEKAEENIRDDIYRLR